MSDQAADDRRISIFLAIMFFMICVYTPNGMKSANVVPRIGLSHALLTDGSFQIDAVAPFTIDKAFFNGHYYCDKAPGMSVMCLPGVALGNATADILGLPKPLYTGLNAPTARYYLLGIGCMLTAAMLLASYTVAVFYRALRRANVSQEAASLVTLSFAFGTPFLIWSTMLFGHGPTAALLFLGFAQYWFIREKPDSVSWRLPLAGLVLGWAIITEFTAAPPAALIGLWLLAGSHGHAPDRLAKSFGLMVSGGLLPLAILLGYNHAAFGSAFKLGYGQVQGFAGMKTGFFGISLPDPAVLWAIIGGSYRGILWLSPVLAVATYACFKLMRAGGERMTGIIALAITVYYLCVNGGYFYWDGGQSTGPRHITPCIPFLMFALGAAWSRLGDAARKTVVALTLYGIFVVTTSTLVDALARDDRQPMLWAHVFPELFSGRLPIPAAKMGMPPLLAYLLPFGVIVVAAWWLDPYPLRRDGSRNLAAATARVD